MNSWPSAERHALLGPELLARWQRFLRADRTFFPTHVGLVLDEVRRGYARIRLPVRPEVEQAAGVLHGGALATLIDTSCIPAIGTFYDRPYDNLWRNTSNNSFTLGRFFTDFGARLDYLQPAQTILKGFGDQLIDTRFPNLILVDPSLRSGYSQSYLFGIRHDLSSAWTMQAHAIGANGEPAGRGVLTPKTLEEMRRPHASQLGADIWGLGTMLYAGNNAAGFVIGHDGNNDPAINTAARVDPETGNGVVVLETGNRLLATTLAGEWLFWRTGNVDFLMLTIEAGNMLRVLAAGWIAIMLTALVIGWRFRRAAGSPSDATGVSASRPDPA